MSKFNAIGAAPIPKENPVNMTVADKALTAITKSLKNTLHTLPPKTIELIASYKKDNPGLDPEKDILPRLLKENLSDNSILQIKNALGLQTEKVTQSNKIGLASDRDVAKGITDTLKHAETKFNEALKAGKSPQEATKISAQEAREYAKKIGLSTDVIKKFLLAKISTAKESNSLQEAQKTNDAIKALHDIGLIDDKAFNEISKFAQDTLKEIEKKNTDALNLLDSAKKNALGVSTSASILNSADTSSLKGIRDLTKRIDSLISKIRDSKMALTKLIDKLRTEMTELKKESEKIIEKGKVAAKTELKKIAQKTEEAKKELQIAKAAMEEEYKQTLGALESKAADPKILPEQKTAITQQIQQLKAEFKQNENSIKVSELNLAALTKVGSLEQKINTAGDLKAAQKYLELVNQEMGLIQFGGDPAILAKKLEPLLLQQSEILTKEIKKSDEKKSAITKLKEDIKTRLASLNGLVDIDKEIEEVIKLFGDTISSPTELVKKVLVKLINELKNRGDIAQLIKLLGTEAVKTLLNGNSELKTQLLTILPKFLSDPFQNNKQ
jgi:myosin heavy subunit